MAGEGSSVLVQFPDDDRPTLWQERLLCCGTGAPNVWVACSPDEDYDVLDLSEVRFRALDGARNLPRGVKESDCYFLFFPGRASAF